MADADALAAACWTDAGPRSARRARELADDPRFAVTVGADAEQQRVDVLERMRGARRIRLLALRLPDEYGGQDDVGASVTAFEMLAYRRPVAAGEGRRPVGAVRRRGPASRHGAAPRRLPRDISSRRAARLLRDDRVRPRVERAGARHHRDVRRRDRASSSSPRRTTRRARTTSATRPRDGHVAVVFAQLDDRRRGPGRARLRGADPRRGRDDRARASRIEDDGLKAGLNGVDNGRLCFDDVRVPRENLLNRYGRRHRGRRVLDADREQDRALLHDARHAGPGPDQRRRRRGQRHQGRAHHRRPVRRTAAPVRARPAATTRAGPRLPGAPAPAAARAGQDLRPPLRPGASWLREPARPRRSASDADDPTGASSRRGPPASRRSRPGTPPRRSRTCREACGGAGYLAENRLPGLKADTDVFTTFEGDNPVLLQLVAKELLTGYKRPLRRARPARHGPLRRRSSRRDRSSNGSAVTGGCSGCSTPVPVTTRPGCSTAIWHLDLFAWRERHRSKRSRAACAARPTATTRSRCSTSAQDHLLLTARAHMDNLLLQAFVDGIEACPDEAVRALLERVCDLYALSTIEQERGWFQEHGRLTATRAKAVLAEVNALCAAAAPARPRADRCVRDPRGRTRQPTPTRILTRSRVLSSCLPGVFTA